jgi:hypothetical protein
MNLVGAKSCVISLNEQQYGNFTYLNMHVLQLF